MKHEETMQLLVDLEEGRLRGPEREEVIEHARSCDKCRDWSETFQLFSLALSPGSVSHASSELLARFASEPDRLSAPDAKALKMHLETCGSCRQGVEATREALRQARRRSGDRMDSMRFYAGRLAIAAAAVLGIALTFFMSSPGAVQPVDRSLTDDSLSGVHLIEATSSITASAVAVERDGDVTLRAGDSVVLGDGFSIGENARFTVEVGWPPGEKEEDVPPRS